MIDFFIGVGGGWVCEPPGNDDTIYEQPDTGLSLTFMMVGNLSTITKGRISLK